MAFDMAKYKFNKKTEQLRIDYAENAELMLRDRTYTKKRPPKPVHSFPHLLNKKFPVKKIKWLYQDAPIKAVNTFHITEADRIKQALRRGAVEKTQYDD
jgi:hypothetical protein